MSIIDNRKFRDSLCLNVWYIEYIIYGFRRFYDGILKNFLYNIVSVPEEIILTFMEKMGMNLTRCEQSTVLPERGTVVVQSLLDIQWALSLIKKTLQKESQCQTD